MVSPRLPFLCCRVVLVGDPQQLPATILSELAKQASPSAGCWWLPFCLELLDICLSTRNLLLHAPCLSWPGRQSRAEHMLLRGRSPTAAGLLSGGKPGSRCVAAKKHWWPCCPAPLRPTMRLLDAAPPSCPLVAPGFPLPPAVEPFQPSPFNLFSSFAYSLRFPPHFNLRLSASSQRSLHPPPLSTFNLFFSTLTLTLLLFNLQSLFNVHLHPPPFATVTFQPPSTSTSTLHLSQPSPFNLLLNVHLHPPSFRNHRPSTSF